MISSVKSPKRRNSLTAALLLSPICSLFWAACIDADDANLRKRFAVEYPAAMHKIRSVYSQPRIKMRWTFPPTAPGGIPIRSNVEFARSGELCRVVSIPYESDPNDTRYFTEQLAMVANPRISFRLEPSNVIGENSSSQTQWQVGSLDDHSSRIFNIGIVFRGPFAPWSIYEETVESWMSHRQFQVRSFDYERQGTEKVARMVWEDRDPDDDGGATWVGWFAFDPESWVLKGWRYGGFEKGQDASGLTEKGRQGAIDYSGSFDGVPLIKKVEFWIDDPSQGSKLEVETWEVLDIEVVQTPEWEFTLLAFGLPDVVDTSNRPNHIYIFLFVGVMLTVIGVAISLWRRRVDAGGQSK